MYTASKDENVSTMKNAAQNLRNSATEVAEETKNDLRVVAGNAGRKVRDFIHSAEDEITHARDTVTTQIRTKPVQSSLMALGLGFVLGALLRR